MLLSVIIPAFNVEFYIKSSVNSILEQIQDSSLVEIIIINDGSTDRTAEITSQLSYAYSCVRVIHQQNGGVSSARNVGISAASGQFILFLDADDQLEKLALEPVLNYLKFIEVDMLILGYRKVDELGNIHYSTNHHDLANKSYQHLKCYYEAIGENSLIADTNRCWGILYKTEKLKQFTQPFPIGVPYLEDAAFLAKFFVVMNNYAVLDLIICTRLIRKGSAVNSDLFVSKRAINGFNLALNDLLKFRDSILHRGDIMEDRIFHLNQTIIKFATLRIISAINSGSKELLQETIVVAENDHLKLNVKKVRYPFNIWGIAYNISIDLFIHVFKLHSRLRYLKSKMGL